ncbi:SEC12-like protein 2 [Hibiscus syriacus]|uniref:SEC12-like protein 2 n=1 Tax=Hibiscus syriacus TaxID=106335 RepID=A0A6A3BRK8_HIBSY|nr:SEC12-like protein 2 [Hibiscus syriacus]KAE8719273.1 SEC12-like protein 2 [Hibiscus syriacus]
MTDAPSDLQKYGVPFYGAGWVPYNQVRSKLASKEKVEEDKKEEKDTTPSNADETATTLNYVVLAGGGGEGRSGIPNAIVVSHVDLASNSLSDQPVVKHETGSDLPYRMTVHPHGDGILCSFQQNCRLFEWKDSEGSEVHKLGVKVSEKVLTQLEDVGQQLALTFNCEGSILAVGGEDGSLRVFKWPSMEKILNEAQAHSSVKNLDFSCDGKFLVSLGSALCRVWDVTSSKVVTSLAKGNDEVFAFCRFSPINDKNSHLYIAAVTDHGGSILTYNTTTWKRIHTSRVVREAISAFNVSSDGKFLAVGTVGGDLFIINAANMKVQMMVKKAHLGLVTALTFSPDSRAVVSASLDSSARVTLIKDNNKSGGMSWVIIILMVLLAVAVYFMKNGIIP